jgi:GNAT superfamily N-acetyltransferase
MIVRDATPADAEAMSRVLIASITTLCERDHGGVQENLDHWLANKSPASVRAWFDNPENRLFVAERNEEVVGVGGFNERGDVLLNYVAPAARFTGVSTVLLAEIERAMQAKGHDKATLTSTATAHEFYIARGWRDDGAPKPRFAVLVHPMTKSIT